MPRKKPFSGKQKKLQLQERRNKKQDGPRYLADDKDEGEDNSASAEPLGGKNEAQGDNSASQNMEIQKINLQPNTRETTGLDVNSFRLHFFKDSQDLIAKKKREARKPVRPVGEKQLEFKLEDVYPPGAKLDIPKRPAWNYHQTKEQLDLQEKQYFSSYISDILDQSRVQDLSYFELNLETWRQLWRVLEISDILLIIADIRYPVLQVPPSLINHILKELHKHVIILLNKVDYVPAVLALSWKRYLQSVLPGIHVVFFTSFPRESKSEENPVNFDPTANLYKRPFHQKVLPVGSSELYHVVKEIVASNVDLSSWEKKLTDSALIQPEEETDQSEGRKDRVLDGDSQSEGRKGGVSEEDSQSEFRRQDSDAAVAKQSHEVYSDQTDQPLYNRYKDGVVTIGCIGYPNAGKSSVLNALVGKKVVSVSKTPGHTKHFQTIFLSETVRLCDCPGLVFPSMISKSLQVVAGIFPVAQVKEPYSVVAYLAKRLDLPGLLRLTHPNLSARKDRDGRESDWSAYDICEAWAMKNGFTTSKAGRPDVYRAANKILRLAVEGQLCLCFRPPNFSEHSAELSSDPETQQLSDLMNTRSQDAHRVVERDGERGEEEESDESQSEEEEEDREKEENVKEENERCKRQGGILRQLEEFDLQEEDNDDPT